MANQKEIRTKIDSVKKTKKITSAMKLVAAAKVRKVQKKVVAARPFSDKLSGIINSLREAVKQDIDISKYPLLRNSSEVKKVLLLVISSDRGLCGGYNSNIVKAANKRISEIKAAGQEPVIFTVGRKATSALQKAGENVTDSMVNLPSMPTVTEAEVIAEKVEKLFKDGEVDKVELVSTKFISMVRADVETHNFLPINLSEEFGETENKPNPYIIFDKDIDSLINALLPMFVQNFIFQALLEATASELAARMTAMSNATTNADNFINGLVLTYNKARQASITQELSEIVAGAAALG